MFSLKISFFLNLAHYTCEDIINSLDFCRLRRPNWSFLVRYNFVSLRETVSLHSFGLPGPLPAFGRRPSQTCDEGYSPSSLAVSAIDPQLTGPWLALACFSCFAASAGSANAWASYTWCDWPGQAELVQGCRRQNPEGYGAALLLIFILPTALSWAKLRFARLVARDPASQDPSLRERLREPSAPVVATCGRSEDRDNSRELRSLPWLGGGGPLRGPRPRSCGWPSAIPFAERSSAYNPTRPNTAAGARTLVMGPGAPKGPRTLRCDFSHTISAAKLL